MTRSKDYIYKLIADSLDRELGLPLTEMSQSRKEAILKLNSLEDTYLEHICKIAMCGNSTGNMYHWIGEVAQCLFDANDTRLKQGGKLEKEIISAEFLMATGDSFNECKPCIERVCKKLLRGYPTAKITEDVLEVAHTILVDFNEYFSGVLATKNSYDKNWFKNKLLEYFRLED